MSDSIEIVGHPPPHDGNAAQRPRVLPDRPPTLRIQPVTICEFLAALFGHLPDDLAFATKVLVGEKWVKPDRYTASQISKAADSVARLATRQDANVYVHCNAVPASGLLSKTGFVRGKEDIRRRTYLLIDVDPIRVSPNGGELVTETTDADGTVTRTKVRCHATSEEKAEATRLWQHVRRTLDIYGFPPPTAVVDTGNGIHGWLPLDLPADAETNRLLADFLKALECKHHGLFRAIIDTSTHDAVRIGRVPGTLNAKYPDQPGRPAREAVLLETGVRAPVSAELIQKFVADHAPKEKRKAKQVRGPGSAEPEEKPKPERVAAALEFVRGADDYDEWRRIGMALHDWDSLCGFALWCNWSSTSTKYTEATCREKWNSFGAGGGLTIRTVFRLALDNGWKPPRGPKPAILQNGKPIGTNGDGHHAEKSTAKLIEVLTRREQKSGGGPPKGGDAKPADEPVTGWVIIRDYFAARYGDGYRAGDAIYCNRERREVRRQEACAALPPNLIEGLGRAANTPRFKGQNGAPGEVNVDGLPAFFRKWAGTAWVAFIGGLSDEDGAEPGAVEVAAEDFRRLVRQALLSEFTLARTVMDERRQKEVRFEQRSAVGWCESFARNKPAGGWHSIRSKKLWFRNVEVSGSPGELRLQVAFRHELLSQLRADRRLIDIGSNAFTRRAKRYGVGQHGGQSDRPGGAWALILADDFLDDLIATLPATESCTAPNVQPDSDDDVQDVEDED